MNFCTGYGVTSGIMVGGNFVPVQPLVSPSTKVTFFNVLPFTADEDIERELSRFGKFASGIKIMQLWTICFLIRDVIDVSTNSNCDIGSLSIDQEKAFDIHIFLKVSEASFSV